jgi:hypothetical protein
MDPAVAAQIVASLDAELARRRAKRDAEEDARWRAEYPDDPVAFLARYLERFANRLHEPSPPGALELSDRDREMQRRQLEDIAEQVTELADRLESQFRHEEAVRNGEPRRRPVVIGPRVRAPHLLAKEPNLNGENGKSKKLSRTEQAQAKAELQARQALVRQSQHRPAQPGQEPEGVWRLGSVVRYDTRSMAGIVSFGSGVGPVEAPFEAMVKSGLVALHPTQKLECHVSERADGTLAISEIRLSAGERAAAIAERQAQGG